MIAPARTPRFQPGQLVRHVRYGYRGVVVEVDSCCRAPDAWYQANRTQPDRSQPWYHVLVHGGGNVTYAAQTSLSADPSAAPIDHPLIDAFFDAFDGNTYARNDRPWQGW
jgi:heat shock protein HspQ